MGLVALMDRNEEQKLDRAVSPQLLAMIEAADRGFHNYLLRQHLSSWHPISTAPANHNLELKVLDGATVTILPFPCLQANDGAWINADLGTSLLIQPVKWRPWQKSKVPQA
jgi:hypothetical protein